MDRKYIFQLFWIQQNENQIKTKIEEEIEGSFSSFLVQISIQAGKKQKNTLGKIESWYPTKQTVVMQCLKFLLESPPEITG